MSNNVAFGTAAKRQASKPHTQPEALQEEAPPSAAIVPVASAASGLKIAEPHAPDEIQDTAEQVVSAATQLHPPRSTGRLAASEEAAASVAAPDASMPSGEEPGTAASITEPAKPEASKDEKLASARDRYLARKRKGPDP